MTGNKEKEQSLYSICKDAFAIANDNGKLKDVAVNMDDAVRIVLGMTDIDEFGKDWVFEKTIRTYLCVIANELGFRSGRYGAGVYFSKNIDHEKVSQALVDNAVAKANQMQKSADEMIDLHNKKFDPNCEMSGQSAFDDVDMTMYEEMNLDDMIDFVLGIAK